MFPVLKVEGLIKKYGQKVVLDNISFELYPSDILGIIVPMEQEKAHYFIFFWV